MATSSQNACTHICDRSKPIMRQTEKQERHEDDHRRGKCLMLAGPRRKHAHKYPCRFLLRCHV